jgi:transcriptional regulator with XRE-family HTH domain
MSIVREPEPGGAGLVPCHIQVGEEEMAISRDLPGETQSAARHIPRHAMRRTEPSALAKFVRERLAELGMKQSEFCRLTGFDQGLLSKIQNSMITSLSIESALRLSIGLGVSPKKMFQLIDRMDLDEMVMEAYSSEFKNNVRTLPGSVEEIVQLSLRAHNLGRDLGSIIGSLQGLIGKEARSSP